MDRHHVLWNKREWESRPQYKQLRETHGLIVPMEREAHNELHRAVPFVPVLGYYGILAVNKAFEEGTDHLESIDNLALAIDSIHKNKRMSELERGLANLALESVELQLPFIREGYIKI